MLLAVDSSPASARRRPTANPDATTRTVCIWGYSQATGAPAAMYRDITSYYQYTTPRNPFSVVNARNDDTVHLHIDYGDGDTVCCLNPNESVGSIGTITGIRIDARSSC
jgi:hypothetical protein